MPRELAPQNNNHAHQYGFGIVVLKIQPIDLLWKSSSVFAKTAGEGYTCRRKEEDNIPVLDVLGQHMNVQAKAINKDHKRSMSIMKTHFIDKGKHVMRNKSSILERVALHIATRVEEVWKGGIQGALEHTGGCFWTKYVAGVILCPNAPIRLGVIPQNRSIRGISKERR